jgi:hypothetical protein
MSRDDRFEEHPMSDWPHNKIHTVALRYIRKHVARETDWRFTHIDSLPERLSRYAPARSL